MPSLEMVDVPVEEEQQQQQEEQPSVSSKSSTAKKKRKVSPPDATVVKKKRSNQMTLKAFFKKTATPMAPPKEEEPEVDQLATVNEAKKKVLRDIVLGKTSVNKKLFDTFEQSQKQDSSPSSESDVQESDTRRDETIDLTADSPTKGNDEENAPEMAVESGKEANENDSGDTKMQEDTEEVVVVNETNDVLAVNADDEGKADAETPAQAQGKANNSTMPVDSLQSLDVEMVEKEKSGVVACDKDELKPAAMKSPPIAPMEPTSPVAETKTTSTEPESLSEESQTLLKKHSVMRDTYRRRAQDLLARVRNDIPEETFSIPIPEKSELPNDASFESFPDFALKVLASLTEGSMETLSSLADAATTTLNKIYETDKFTIDMTSTKLKLIAKRKNTIKSPWLVTGEEKGPGASADKFEDACVDQIWRWELVLLDVLPEESLSAVKKARSARKNVGSHFSAFTKLLSALDEADQALLSFPPASSESIEKLVAKVSQNEEKVLQYEQKEEKARLAAETKANKEASKALERKKKEDAAEEKRKEKELKKQQAAEEKQRKKEAAAGLKKKKALEKEEEAKKEKAQKEALANKQKKCMLSFFAPTSAKKTKVAAAGKENATVVPAAASTSVDLECKPASNGFDQASFRSCIGSDKPHDTSLFKNLSKCARLSRRRRTKRVPVMVSVMVNSDDPWAAQPYAEVREIEFPNKYKLLRFHEDVRPAYHGTWSKVSSTVTGRTPFGKDETFLDYDYDSEAEWEEGDDEMGEDIEDDVGDDEEDKMEDDGDDDEDGWLADDDEIDEDLDEETKLIRQKQLRAERHGDRRELNVCFIAPVKGRPLPITAREETSSAIHGLSSEEALSLLKSHSVVVRSDLDVCLDAFPPALLDEFDPTCDASPSSNEKSANSTEMSDDDMRTFVHFVHGCSLGSKDKVVDELRSKHETVTSSRAQAYRLLESMAEKKKHPTNGVVWQVNADVLERLGLGSLVESEETDVNEAKHEVMKTVANFVHNSTFKSKEKVVDELRSKHESIIPSKAEAFRILESVAEKKKHPKGGFYWEVKSAVRDELGLVDLPPSPPDLSQSGSSSPVPDSAVKDQNVPEPNQAVADQKATLDSFVSIAAPAKQGAMKPTATEKTPSKEAVKSDSVDGSSSKKRKDAPVNLLTSFVKKKPKQTSSD